MPADEHEIVLHNDGTWDPLPPKKDELTKISIKPVKPKPVSESTTIIDSDTDSSNPTPGPSGIRKTSAFKDDIACITLDSDSEDEVEAAPNKRIRLDLETGSDTDQPGSPDLICLDDD